MIARIGARPVSGSNNSYGMDNRYRHVHCLGDWAGCNYCWPSEVIAIRQMGQGAQIRTKYHPNNLHAPQCIRHIASKTCRGARHHHCLYRTCAVAYPNHSGHRVGAIRQPRQCHTDCPCRASGHGGVPAPWKPLNLEVGHAGHLVCGNGACGSKVVTRRQPRYIRQFSHDPANRRAPAVSDLPIRALRLRPPPLSARKPPP